MIALLVLQEGPGAGQQYTLDPAQQPVLSVGRSSACQIMLNDHRASRHHADFSWDGRQWTVVDQGSTNGTYVNGMRVHSPYDLRLGDRVTIGETTMVMRQPVAQPPPMAAGPAQAAYGGRSAEDALMSELAGSGRRVEKQQSSAQPQAGFDSARDSQAPPITHKIRHPRDSFLVHMRTSHIAPLFPYHNRRLVRLDHEWFNPPPRHLL